LKEYCRKKAQKAQEKHLLRILRIFAAKKKSLKLALFVTAAVDPGIPMHALA
jgi:hypothetical protein